MLDIFNNYAILVYKKGTHWMMHVYIHFCKGNLVFMRSCGLCHSWSFRFLCLVKLQLFPKVGWAICNSPLPAFLRGEIMTIEEISLLQIGTYLIPNTCPVSSAIKVIEVQDKGLRFRRCHSYYNGEEFFLTKSALVKSKWIVVPEGTQLVLLWKIILTLWLLC